MEQNMTALVSLFTRVYHQKSETKKVRCFSCYHTAIMAKMQYKTAVYLYLSVKMLF